MTVARDLTSGFPVVPPSWRIGEASVHRIDELAGPGFGRWLLPQATPAATGEAEWLRPAFVDSDGELLLSVHAFAVQVDGLRVLVDTGVGNHKPRRTTAWNQLDTPFLQRLADAGFATESVDLVVTTHLHLDHVGWNTHLVDDSWVPTFPRARHVVARAEYDYWTEREAEPERRQMFTDSVDPLRETGQLELLGIPPAGVEVVPGLVLLPTPGHTPGHLSVLLHSGAHTGLITGDCLHHPVQLAHPEWSSSMDTDPDQSVQTRRTLFAQLSASDTLVFGSAFPSPTVGHVRRDGDAYRLVSIPAS